MILWIEKLCELLTAQNSCVFKKCVESAKKRDNETNEKPASSRFAAANKFAANGDRLLARINADRGEYNRAADCERQSSHFCWILKVAAFAI